MGDFDKAEQLMTRAELATRWKVSVKTIDREIRRHLVPYIRVGRQIRFKLADILAYENIGRG